MVDAAVLVGDIRRTITRLDEQRRLAANAAGRALVNQAEIRRACEEQLRVLAGAFGEAENAEVVAHRAAKAAARSSDPADQADLAAFERTATGLHTVQDALGLAAEPIHALLAGARDNVDQARLVLVRARDILDDQIREQVRLLRALELAEQQRVARRFRAR